MSGECIDENLLCDGNADCECECDESRDICAVGPDGELFYDPIDGLNERRRPEDSVTECLEGEFKCTSGECIDESLLCDGVADCECGCDESEAICGAPEPEKCPPGTWECMSGECIDENLLCDGNADCECECDESPEICSMMDGFNGRRRADTEDSLPKCLPGQFECMSGECIDESLVCDGVADCECGCDESEEFCGALPEPETCAPGTFKCTSGECIDESLLCDGNADCECGCDESPEICAMD